MDGAAHPVILIIKLTFFLPSFTLMKKIENHICTQWHEAPVNFNKLLADVFAFDSAKAIEQCVHPLLYLAGTPASGDIEKLKLLNSTMQISQLKSGHFVMLNQPQEANKLLELFAEGVM
jgi:hypothetical protein